MPKTRWLFALAFVAVVPALAGLAAAKPPKSTKEAGKSTPAAAAAGSQIVARVGDRTITMDEVDAQAQASNMKLYQELYNARRAVVDQIVMDEMVAAEAKARGVTEDELIAQEVTQKVQAVNDDDVTAWYESNKQRMGSQTLEQSREQIRGMMASQRQADARKALNDELKAKNAVRVMISAPRATVTVAADEPAKGPLSAPVQIVAFSEFQCPYCARVGPTMAKIHEAYGDRVQIVFRDFPLPMHNNAHAAAQAAQCAHEQGKFWEYHDKLFANQRALSADNLKQYAKDLSLDATQFDTCLDSGKFKAKVDSDHQDGQKLGVQGTPAFFINGRFLSGAQPFEAFQKIIDEELESKGATTTAKG